MRDPALAAVQDLDPADDAPGGYALVDQLDLLIGGHRDRTGDQDVDAVRRLVDHAACRLASPATTVTCVTGEGCLSDLRRFFDAMLPLSCRNLGSRMDPVSSCAGDGAILAYSMENGTMPDRRTGMERTVS